MYGVDSSPLVYSARQLPLCAQGHRILVQVSANRAYVRRQVVAIDMDAIYFLIKGFGAFSRWTDDAYLIAGGAERRRFHPYAPVERNRKILNDYEDVFTRQRHGTPELVALSGTLRAGL